MKKRTSTPQDLSFTETAHLFQVARETVANWVKEGYLETDGQNRITRDSIRRFEQKYAGKIKLHARANKLHKDGVDVEEVSKIILDELHHKAFDASIGDRYEQMLSESFRNKEGVFYTPMNIVDDMMRGVEADDSTLFLDPCCGTGNFLVKAVEKGVSPQNLYGFDTDPVAVMIARRRIKEMTGQEASHVVCSDFLKECPELKVRFDMVYTNPPWGKKIPKADRDKLAKSYQSGSSTDTCSLFLFAALSVLKADGLMGLLMPESFFNIKIFENARKAGVEKRIIVRQRDIKDFREDFEKASVICNPPYGERLLDMEQARELYKIMGQKFIKKQGWSYSIITPDDNFEKYFGRKSDKRRKLYNGMIKCQLHMYVKN